MVNFFEGKLFLHFCEQIFEVVHFHASSDHFDVLILEQVVVSLEQVLQVELLDEFVELMELFPLGGLQLILVLLDFYVEWTGLDGLVDFILGLVEDYVQRGVSKLNVLIVFLNQFLVALGVRLPQVLFHFTHFFESQLRVVLVKCMHCLLQARQMADRPSVGVGDDLRFGFDLFF